MGENLCKYRNINVRRPLELWKVFRGLKQNLNEKIKLGNTEYTN